MSAGKGKKLVYVSEALLEEAVKVCRDEDISLGRLVDVSLLQAVKVNKLGFRSDQMADFFDVLQSNRVLGGLFVPSGVLDYMIKKCCKDDCETIKNLWFESGVWTGKYLAEKFPDPVKAFGRFLELSRWDLNEVAVTKNGAAVRVRCVSTVMTLENTTLLAKFVEGVITSLGYVVEHVDCLKGLIILSSKKP
ncbi:MAG: hypothetical protein NWF05_11610 [Candidatus Bathyarchaeota archaeon]|nr:hypothetical protein [Candidatus Bathyarchaeota archaeon]